MTEAESAVVEKHVKDLWSALKLPEHGLASLRLSGRGKVVPSSFRIADLAQSTIALTGLLAALLHQERSGSSAIPRVSVDRRHACAEFQSEKLYLLNGVKAKSTWGPIGGLHKTADGYVRVHDNFLHHRVGTCRLLGLPDDADREQVAAQIVKWQSIDLETVAAKHNMVVAALRTYSAWDQSPPGQAVAGFPITMRKLAEGIPLPRRQQSVNRSLHGLRVVEMSRVVAAPVAGRTLAAHGADILWVTSPNLPDLPDLDIDLSRGKRTVQIDANTNLPQLQGLIKDADVLLQSYRPGSLAAKGLSSKILLRGRPKDKPLIIANLSAYGIDGPWSERRGFDSLVQTCSGMNVSEAEHNGHGEAARPTPCQALDHGAGYFLAAGIMTAIHNQSIEGGSYQVDVSLAGVMRYLRSLGQYNDQSGFDVEEADLSASIPVDWLDTRDCAFGTLTAIKHSVQIDDLEVGYEFMPKPLGADEPAWL